MTTRQENKLSMYLATKKCLSDNNALWVVFPGIASVVTLFFSKITLIQNTENRQQKSSKGASTSKKEKKIALIDMLLVVIGGIKSYAKDVNDEELFSSVDFSQSELEKLGDSLLIDRANLIIGIANANAANILDKGITAVVLGDLQTLITEYENAVSGPRTVISDKKTATAQLAVLFAQTDELLKDNLDGLILQFKIPNNDFYRNYFNNRIVLDLGTQHTRLGGVITDSEGNPLEGALVTAVGADLEEVSDGEGIYLFKPFIPGDFTITVEKEGFETVTINDVHVSPGQHLVLDVTMQSESGTSNIGGLIRNSALEPVGGATVELVGSFTTISNPAGTYQFTGVPAGNYTMRVTASGYPVKEVPITVPAGQDINFDVTL
jgi:hypothetical protein